MQVNIKFDTETERIESLKKLVDALQKLVAYREGKTSPVLESNHQPVIQDPVQPAPQPIQQVYQTQQPVKQQTFQAPLPQMQAPVQEAPKPEEKKPEDKTSGGCRVVPYEDMTDTMSNIFSK